MYPIAKDGIIEKVFSQIEHSTVILFVSDVERLLLVGFFLALR